MLADRGTVGEGCDVEKGRGFLYAQSRDRGCGHHDQRRYDGRDLRGCQSEKAASVVVSCSGYTTGARRRRAAFQEERGGYLHLRGAAPRHHNHFKYPACLRDKAPII